MNVLIACEESGVVRNAFLRRGHNAFSNDLEQARSGGPHLQCDVIAAVESRSWDLIIVHPPCTAMAASGNRWYATGMPLAEKRHAAVRWTAHLWAVVKRAASFGACLENPVSVCWSALGRPQYVQPWQFGHGEVKRTGLLLDRLPQLRPTNIVSGRIARVHLMPPGPHRQRDRSTTLQGIADAMAAQWG